MHIPCLVRHAVLRSHLSKSYRPVSHHDLLRARNVQTDHPHSPCSLTNLHVFTAACSLHFSFSVIPRLSYVFSISPRVLCLHLGSRCLVFCFHLVSLFLAVLTPLFHNAYENLQSSVFSFLFPSPEVYATASFILSYLEARSRTFLLLGTSAKIRRVFANSSTVNLDCQFLALYIYLLDNSLDIVFHFSPSFLFSLARPQCRSTLSCYQYLNGLELRSVLPDHSQEAGRSGLFLAFLLCRGLDNTQGSPPVQRCANTKIGNLCGSHKCGNGVGCAEYTDKGWLGGPNRGIFNSTI